MTGPIELLFEQPTEAPAGLVQFFVGPQGTPGPQGSGGLLVAGAVPTASSLPATAVIGELWITKDDGHGHAWTAAGWVDVGQAAIQGPPGADGKDGQIRYTGHGAPTLIVGSEPGDTYLDTLTGVIYTLA